jgi:hypothetical protein
VIKKRREQGGHSLRWAAEPEKIIIIINNNNMSTYYMEATGQLHAPAALTSTKNPGTMLGEIQNRSERFEKGKTSLFFTGSDLQMKRGGVGEMRTLN